LNHIEILAVLAAKPLADTVSAAELRLLKTVAKDTYDELDLIDAPRNLSYDTILDKLLALLLYLRTKRAFERKKQKLL
jgi:hypothetical protein